jgi:hypothetical protein
MVPGSTGGKATVESYLLEVVSRSVAGSMGPKRYVLSWDLADRALAYWPGSTLVDVGGRAAEYPDGTSAGPHLQKQDEGGVPPKLWNG